MSHTVICCLLCLLLKALLWSFKWTFRRFSSSYKCVVFALSMKGSWLIRVMKDRVTRVDSRELTGIRAVLWDTEVVRKAKTQLWVPHQAGSSLLPFSASPACLAKANNINISNFWRIPFWTSSFQNRAASEVILPMWFHQKNFLTLSCKSCQLHVTNFYCIS